VVVVVEQKKEEEEDTCVKSEDRADTNVYVI
jgi:hypothetical protein